MRLSSPETLWTWWLEDDDGRLYLEDDPMSESIDPMSLVLTAFMVAFLRVVDTVLALQAGLPMQDLRPRSLAELDEEAHRYVEQILAVRAPAATGRAN